METFVELKALIGDFQAKMATARAEMDSTHKSGAASFSALHSVTGAALGGVAVAAATAAVASVKMAADFQTSMTSLVTGAGESEANIKKVSQGILDMAPKVGATTQQLASGMYMIESAGFHGAAGLTVLKAAAEGAKVGNADLGTVADAVTTILNDYHLSAGQAATVTSKLVETVASGKTHMQDLAGSLAAVAPAAAASHVGLNQVLGAMATMTAKGTPAADAATYLRQTILQLSNPTAKAATEMQALGLNAIDVSSHLGTRGLTGTLSLLTSAIAAHMGPQGTVLIEQMKKAAGNTSTFQKILANLPPAQQTYVGALANMVGGTKSMQAALELTGDSAKTFQQNVKTISGTTADAKGNVLGWTTVQGDFNQKLSEAKAAVQVMFIELGTKLIPVVEKVAKATASAVLWFQKHKDVVLALAIVIGTILVGAIGVWVVTTIAAMSFVAAATGGVIIAIGLLAAGIVWMATHWSQVWGDIKQWTDDAIKFLRSGFGTLIVALTGPIAPLLLLALHWQQVWDGMKQVIGTVMAGILTYVRTLGDVFFTVIEGILGAASHLPFVGHYFAEANKAVHAFQQDMDSTLSGLANNMGAWGQTAGTQFAAGMDRGLQAELPALMANTTQMAASLVANMNKRLGVHSPSRLTAEMGRQLIRGLEVGMTGELPNLAALSATLPAVVVSAPGGAVTAGPSVRPSAGQTVIVGPVTVQGHVLNENGFADQFAQAIQGALLRRQRSQRLGLT